MGCSNGKQVTEASSQKPEAGAILLGSEAANGATIAKIGSGEPAASLEVGVVFETPSYGKAVLEELKQGEAGVTYAVLKLQTGFVSVPQETAILWLAMSREAAAPPAQTKAGQLELGVALDTPYGPGTVEALKPGELDETLIYAVVKLGSGFVSVPSATAETWMSAATPAAPTQEAPGCPPTTAAAEAGAEREVAVLVTEAAAAVQEPVATVAPFAEKSSPKEAEAELVAEEVRTGLNCGQVTVTKNCFCAEGYLRPQESVVAVAATQEFAEKEGAPGSRLVAVA